MEVLGWCLRARLVVEVCEFFGGRLAFANGFGKCAGRDGMDCLPLGLFVGEKISWIWQAGL